MRSLRDIQNVLWAVLPLYRGPFGEPRGGFDCRGFLREMNSISAGPSGRAV